MRSGTRVGGEGPAKDSGSTGRVGSKSTYVSTFPGLPASNLLSPAPGLFWQEEMDWLRCGGAWLASGPTEMNPIPYPQPPAVPLLLEVQAAAFRVTK